jgi:hypothetical protein
VSQELLAMLKWLSLGLHQQAMAALWFQIMSFNIAAIAEALGSLSRMV